MVCGGAAAGEANRMTESLRSERDLLLDALPDDYAALIRAHPDVDDLLEVVLDLGRVAEARYRSRETPLGEREVTAEDIVHVIARIGDFGEDNRAGIPRTLHRISGIRNRRGTVIGLTCRVGRAIFGTVAILRDLVESGRSILLLGKPGTGKTTMLRETARVLGDELRKRVVIVDTSNEIAGDGDIPHPGIGRARRMQVPRPSAQHGIMIEAVENHMPEVIVIDEISTELEAAAARTIAERGVQLIGTAHGNTLDNLLVNPTMSDLIGGIQSVTLGDDEARRRGTQKTVLERKSPPTFDILVEIQNWDRVTVYSDVAGAVDAILRGESPDCEERTRGVDGEVIVRAVEREIEDGTMPPARRSSGRRGERDRDRDRESLGLPGGPRLRDRGVPTAGSERSEPARDGTQRIFPFGVSRNRLESAIERLRVPAVIVRDMKDATLVMTLKNYYRQSGQRLRQAEEQGVPVYVLRNNTVTQMERQLAQVFHLKEVSEDEPPRRPGDFALDAAMDEAEAAIVRVMNGEHAAVELAPRSSYIRRLQHQMADRYNLRSESRGDDPNRRVKISRS
jgi:stage III sporulation protein SpoIIIAA